MKKILLILIFAHSIVNATSLEDSYRAEEITIQKAEFHESDKQVKIRLGDRVRFKITVFEGEFFGDTNISANAHIDNGMDVKVKAVYNIAFFDADEKLVGCAQGTWDLEPNEDINYGSGFVFADSESIQNVRSYKLKTQVFELKEQ